MGQSTWEASIYRLGPKNLGSSTRFRRRRRREKFLSTFFEIFVKFVNKNAIKVIFGVICVEVSRKFSKNPHFWQKSISTHARKFRKYFYTGALTPTPKNISEKHPIKAIFRNLLRDTFFKNPD